MKEDQIRITEKRIWHEAVRAGLLDKVEKEEGGVVRKAFDAAAGQIATPGDAIDATSEVLANVLAESVLRLRVHVAVQRRIIAALVKALPDPERHALEHDIRTMSLGDLTVQG
ncbi:MAG: hypothetical protein K8T20_02845 [Planctomycetes bacterium]|nr:hypothetical protein [Planctomycetota bacterium]